jgi:hypothetical protein
VQKYKKPPQKCYSISKREGKHRFYSGGDREQAILLPDTIGDAITAVTDSGYASIRDITVVMKRGIPVIETDLTDEEKAIIAEGDLLY